MNIRTPQVSCQNLLTASYFRNSGARTSWYIAGKLIEVILAREGSFTFRSNAATSDRKPRFPRQTKAEEGWGTQYRSLPSHCQISHCSKIYITSSRLLKLEHYSFSAMSVRLHIPIRKVSRFFIFWPLWFSDNSTIFVEELLADNSVQFICKFPQLTCRSNVLLVISQHLHFILYSESTSIHHEDHPKSYITQHGEDCWQEIHRSGGIESYSQFFSFDNNHARV